MYFALSACLFLASALLAMSGEGPKAMHYVAGMFLAMGLMEK
jgi:hypothetical protein